MRVTPWIAATVVAGAVLWSAPAPPALGGRPPPSVTDVEGSYLFKVKTSWVTIEDGVVHTQKLTERWNITRASDSSAEVTIPDQDLGFDGYFANGVLVWGYHDDSYPFDHFGVLRFSGKPGKTKAKGQVAWVGNDGDELELMNGKRMDDPPEPTKSASKDGKTAAHPAVGDLVGTYKFTLKGTLYELMSGRQRKGHDRATITVREGTESDLVVRIEEEDIEFDARYREGVITLSVLDDPTDATFAICSRLFVTGKPGKLRISGPFLSFHGLGLPDGEAELGKLTAKQLRP